MQTVFGEMANWERVGVGDERLGEREWEGEGGGGGG